MAGEEVLLTLGEVAIAVAGFSSIVAVFGRRAAGEWSSVESFRLAVLIANAVAPALLAFLPFVLENLGLSQSVVWSLSSATLLLFIVLETGWVFRSGPAIFREAAQSIRPELMIVMNLLSLIAAGLQTLNIAGVVFHRELGPYLAGLLLLLAMAVIQFCVLIFSPTAPSETRKEK